MLVSRTTLSASASVLAKPSLPSVALFSSARTLATVGAGSATKSGRVNNLFQPAVHRVPTESVAGGDGAKQESSHLLSQEQLELHEKLEWSDSDVRSAAEDHICMTWGATDPMLKGALWPVRGEGVYFYDSTGKKYIDFNSMAMCSSLGHSVPKEVKQAISDQLDSLPYCYPGIGVVPIRARLSKMLADLCPGDLNTFMFPSTGMEANEVAVRMARVMTGRPKVLSRYRSYHGGSTTTMAMTGDFRRVPAEQGATGHVRMFDPFPYSFSWGSTEEEITQACLKYTRELIHHEGPHTIAAIYMESVTGTNGILKPPKGYMEGIRALCDEYGIMMVCDEVMAGFGRTGKLFGFMHSNAIPDIFTGAKGINSAYLPLGCVGMRDHVAKYFKTNPIWAGSTYNSHPVAVASAYAVLKYLAKHRVVEHARDMESVMVEGHERLIRNHPSVKQARQVGVFGCFDVQKNRKGDFIAEVYSPPAPAMAEFKKRLNESGMFTMMRGHNVFTNPPLIINPQEIKEAFDILDKCLSILDDAMEDN